MKKLRELMDLTGRVAVVTGGAGHIGRALCESLAELGAAVVVVDQTVETSRQVAAGLCEVFGARARPLVVDLSNRADCQTIAARVLAEFNRLDILVNCAAYVGTSKLDNWATEFSKQSPDFWPAALDLNLIVPFVLAQSCAEALAQHGCGSVINIASIYGIVGPNMRLYEGTTLGNPAAYAASKGGLLQLTRWLATAMAPKVRVNAISPGGIWRSQADAFHRRYIERTPLQRMGAEEELKGAIAYLASDLSAYVTGHNLVVDGGWTAW